MNWYELRNTALKLTQAVFLRDPKKVKEVFEEIAIQLNMLNITQTTHTKE